MIVKNVYAERLNQAWLRIEELAHEKKMSIRTLANIAKVNPSNCYFCIRNARKGGVRDTQVAVLRALAVALEVPLGYILDGEPSPEVKPMEGVDLLSVLKDSVHDPMKAVSSVMPYLTPEQRLAIHREIQARVPFGLEAENARYAGDKVTDEMNVITGRKVKESASERVFRRSSRKIKNKERA